MSRNADIKNFLVKHRAKLNPTDFGFSAQNRRVDGLRREEVAQLAAVSVSWYTWLEQGRDISISPAALKRIGKVLQLTMIEQQYLNAIVLGGGASNEDNAELSPEVIAMVDALHPHPAFVRRANMDILYWNRAAETHIFDWSLIAPAERNSLKLMFLSAAYRKRIFEWEKAARHTIAAFRAYQVAERFTENFESIITELIEKSDEFREMWDFHDVSRMGAGNKAIIDDKGSISRYTYTSLEVENSPGIYLIFYLEDHKSAGKNA